MASNKHLVLRKTGNSVRSKCYPEDVSNDKGRKANFRKSCKNFQIFHDQTYKEQTRVIFDNDRKRIIIHDSH